jgi:lipid A disaccharide synthetase
LLPGSRQGELGMLADTYVQTAKLIRERLPDALFVVPLATRETRLLFEAAIYRQQAPTPAVPPAFRSRPGRPWRRRCRWSPAVRRRSKRR